MTVLLYVLAGWVALSVPCSVVLFALGRAAQRCDEQTPYVPATPLGDLSPVSAARASVCSGCAVLYVGGPDAGHCPVCEGETVATPRVGELSALHLV